MRHFFDIAIQPEYNGRQVPVSRYVYKEMFLVKLYIFKGMLYRIQWELS